VQAWFGRSHPGDSPYRLYALSNAGSLVALIAYPAVVEPSLGRHAQAGWWSAGLGLYALLAAWCGAVVWRRSGDGGGSAPPAGPPGAASDRPARARRALWFALPACGSIVLLAVTNRLCRDVAVVPFLWVLPLGLYLLTFIASFDDPRWYRRPLWLPALAGALGAVLWLMAGEWPIDEGTPGLRRVAWLVAPAEDAELPTEAAVYLAALVAACMVCHGEVYRLRPAASGLTGYYLSVAAGGACGGVLVAVVAPLAFTDYFELHVGLFLSAALALAALWGDPESRLARGRPRWAWGAAAAGLAALGVALQYDARVTLGDAAERSRNFYGVLKVFETHARDRERHKRTLLHGGTTHGLQFLAAHKRRLPTTYYGATSGVGWLLRAYRPEGGRRVAVVGLGAGTLAVWGRPGDRFRFYEIDADVERIARRRFTFLADSPAATEVVLGDARLSLEREPAQAFDVVVLDAFTSDAIPVHLLTREAFATYLRHLGPGGVIAVHVSNRYLDLEPVVLRAAEHFGLAGAIVNDEEPEDEDAEETTGIYGSDWVLLARDDALLGRSPILEASSERPDVPARLRLWTDDASDLLRVLLVGADSLLGRLLRRAS
jgi:SAM-dependent methyltransferase